MGDTSRLPELKPYLNFNNKENDKGKPSIVELKKKNFGYKV